MSWHLAPALDRLRDEVNAKWPNRSKASDGTIGDAAHSSRTSDHNPNPRGSVNAIDITASGIDTDVLIAAAKKHPSVRYIIFNRRIMNRDIGNFRSRPYSGSNPHTQHVHISLYQRRSAEDDTRSWGLGKPSSSKPAPAKPKKPGTKPEPFPLPDGHWYGPESKNPKNHSGYYPKDRPGIRTWQTQMKTERGWSAIGKIDGVFGDNCYKVARQFQAEKGLTVDGGVGRETWDASWEEPVT